MGNVINFPPRQRLDVSRLANGPWYFRLCNDFFTQSRADPFWEMIINRKSPFFVKSMRFLPLSLVFVFEMGLVSVLFKGDCWWRITGGKKLNPNFHFTRHTSHCTNWATIVFWQKRKNFPAYAESSPAQKDGRKKEDPECKWRFVVWRRPRESLTRGNGSRRLGRLARSGPRYCSNTEGDDVGLFFSPSSTPVQFFFVDNRGGGSLLSIRQRHHRVSHSFSTDCALCRASDKNTSALIVFPERFVKLFLKNLIFGNHFDQHGSCLSRLTPSAVHFAVAAAFVGSAVRPPRPGRQRPADRKRLR